MGVSAYESSVFKLLLSFERDLNFHEFLSFFAENRVVECNMNPYSTIPYLFHLYCKLKIDVF